MSGIIKKFPKNFNLMVLNLCISRLGTSYFGIIIIWITLVQTNSSFYTGIVASMTTIPYFLSIIVSAIVDNTKRRKMIAYLANIVKILVPLAVISSIFFSDIIFKLLILSIAAFILTLGADFLSAVRASWVKIFITSEQMFKQAVSFVASAQTIFQVLGYAISGLFLTYNFYLPNLFLMLIFSLGLIPLFLIKYDESSLDIKKQSLTSATLETFSFIFKEEALFQVMSFVLIFNALFVMSSIFYASLVYFNNLNSIYLSGFFIAQVLGISLGSLLLSRIKGKSGRITSISMLAIGLAYLTLPFMPIFYLTYISAIFAGLFFGIASSLTLTLITKLSPVNILARVQGFLNTFVIAISFIGDILSGYIVQLTSVNISFMLLGLSFIIISPLVFFFRKLSSIEV
jgi:Major Facilitator Superfamily.